MRDRRSISTPPGRCPPPNHGRHRYYFKLSALDVASLSLEAGGGRATVDDVLQGHILGQAELCNMTQLLPLSGRT